MMDRERSPQAESKAKAAQGSFNSYSCKT